MIINTLYNFDDTTSIGLDKVPNNNIIYINDIGNGNSEMIIITSKVGITNTSTISDLITSGNYKFVNNLKGIINTTYYYDTVTVSFGTTVVAGKIWDNITKQAGNDIIFSYRMPFRSDNTGWDGAETEMLYSIDGGTNYITMGNTGHNGGVMNNNASGIGSISGTVFLDIQAIRDATQVRFKYLHRSYAGTVRINETHNIATGVRGIFWNSITVQEVGR